MELIVKDLLEELRLKSAGHLDQAENYKRLSEKVLNTRLNEDSWSVLECLEHLNLYGDFYLDELERCILKSNSTPQRMFKSTWFANRTVLSMLPKEGEKLNKMKAFKNKTPNKSRLSLTILDRFIKQQHRLINLLNKAEQVNLTKVKTRITLPVLKFRLGDTFRFVIYHNERHMIQAENVVTSLNSK